MAAPLPIYVRQQDFDYVNQTMEYLVDKRKASGSFVSTLKFTVIDESAPFTVEGVTFVPLVRGNNNAQSTNIVAHQLCNSPSNTAPITPHLVLSSVM